MRSFASYKNKAVQLRRSGRTYKDIQEILEVKIPKSTLSLWFSGVNFSTLEKKKIIRRASQNIREGRKKALSRNQELRATYLKTINNRVMHLPDLLVNKDIAKLTFAVLYWCEGSKHCRGSLTFGNSDPSIICTFLKLLRKCYKVDEGKLRCTVQCRADQSTRQLEFFWSRATKIPRKQFYRTRIDSRTIGKPSKKRDYKGVCRIDYFSADVYNELQAIAVLLSRNHTGR